MKKSLVWLAGLLLAISLFGQGEIDFERRVVRATGIGSPNPNMPNMAAKRAGAINAAKQVALRDLIGTIKGMYINSENTVENYMTTSDIITGKVEGIAKAYRVVAGPKYLDDGSVEMTVEMSIDGNLADILLPAEQFTNNPPPASNNSQTATTNNGGVFSGLVVDCSAISLRPALAPKIIDQTGREIYGSANVDREFAIQQGMMGYLKDITKAKGNTRIGDNPLTIKAVATSGANNVDIVISNDDANKLADLSTKLNFLRECKVIAIIK